MNTERLQAKKEALRLNREAVATLKKLIYSIVDKLDLDEDRMTARVDSAVRSEYGATNGLINLLSAIANWPADQGDGASVSTNRKILEDDFQLDLLMLEDIRGFRGYHSFVSDDLEIIEGVMPQYEDYTDYCTILLEELGLTSNRPTICAESWARAETKAKERAKDDLIEKKDEIAKHKQFIADQSN